MDPCMQAHLETRGKKAVAALEKNGFAAAYFPDRIRAVAHLLGLVPDKAAVGLGGSETIRALDIGQKLAQKGCTLLDHLKDGLTSAESEESKALRRKQLTSDVFLCSSNAVTMQGELVNVDGVGNRVSAMMFGPKRVIIVVGMNKLVSSLDDAYGRIKTIVAPANNRRRNRPNPCIEAGECVDCRSKTRICNLTTIIHRRPPLTDIHVLVIGEALGY